MINKKYLKILRSQNRYDENNFIYTIIAKRIVDSLDLLKIDLDQILEIGINEDIIFNYIKNKFTKKNIHRSDLCSSKTKINRFSFLEINLDNLSFKRDYYNLIYSNCFIHIADDFQKNLDVIFKSLKSNGFFIAAIPDKDSMFQLLNSMYKTDLYFYNGAYKRVNNTIEIDNILSILKKLNFDAPSIHSDSISIDYQIFNKLLNDVRKMNLSYCYLDKKQKFENKNYINVLEKFYKKNYFDTNYKLDIKINIISGWKK